MKTTLILLLTLFVYKAHAQEDTDVSIQISELVQTIKNAKHDSIKVKAYFQWDDLIWMTDPALDLKINVRVDSLCSKKLQFKLKAGEKRFYLFSKAKALNNLGSIYFDQGNYTKAIDCHSQSLKLRQEIKDRDGISASLNNLGNVYLNRGDYIRAIQYYTKSLKEFEESGNKKGAATALNNIGAIYKEQEEFDKALEFHRRSLKLRKEVKDEEGVANSLNNIAITYEEQAKYSKAIPIFKESIALSKAIDNFKGLSASLINIGICYKNLGDYELALKSYEQSIAIAEEYGYRDDLATSLSNIGGIYSDNKEYKLVIVYCTQALQIAQEMGLKPVMRDASAYLYESYKANGNLKLALEMHELFVSVRDDLESEANQKELIRQEFRYVYEKQIAEDSVENVANLLVEQTKTKNQKQQSYFLFGGLALSLLFAGFLFNRFRITTRQKKTIEKQKEQVDEAYESLEEKSSEILASIKYAKRIQTAILPSKKKIDRLLPDSFVLYKPKDIVAGDFYWIEEKEDTILFAAADCTGHGVPGAMVSVVCNNALNRAVREYHLTDPGLILDKTREIVVAEFEKSEEDVKDGMDIALCALHGTTLYYAGANNPLWIFRGEDFIEIKANKQPIGKFENYTAYTCHQVDLKTGDTIYIFSDGFADQFGGELGKKLRSGVFNNFLKEISKLPMTEQKERLNSFFEDWKGTREQLDDICVIGVRVM